ncbi:MAG: Flp pilus assembly complex ATPase component TadA [Alphaproteobacteria bacterium]|nr:Flp pilus assembly complex ATPase component TadA [Alphaproteobacteria bacterium]
MFFSSKHQDNDKKSASVPKTPDIPKAPGILPAAELPPEQPQQPAQSVSEQQPAEAPVTQAPKFLSATEILDEKDLIEDTTNLPPVPEKTESSAAAGTSTEESSLVSEPLEKPVLDPISVSSESEEKEEASSGLAQQVIEQPKEEPSAPKIDDVWFSDLYFTPEKIAYVRDKKTQFGLKVFEAEDLMDFHKALEEGFQGSSSYSIHYGLSLYRIERIKTVTGIHYTARRMPREVPSVYQLGMPEILVKYLTSLNGATGLILLCGPTGMGKTTTATALLKYFLENEGGFAYTVEDPPEMPLDGLYQAKSGGLGLCKQTEVVNNNWELGLRSALRSKPRYILVGETRTGETASELLRASTSGHLVISTIHANNLEDGLGSLIKYAGASGMNEELAADLLARGILGVIHQKLTGTQKLTPVLSYCFANPNPMEADQMRMVIRDGKINLATLMEAQTAKMIQGKPLFENI